MQARSLLLTRRGLRFFRWGLTTAAAAVVLLLLMPFLALTGGVALPLARMLAGVVEAMFVAAPLLMAMGIVLVAAAPPQSRVRVWALAALVFVAVANLWPVICFGADLPTAFLDGPLGRLGKLLPIVQGVCFSAMLAALCRFVASIERRDVEGREPEHVVGVDAEDAVAWERLAGRSGRILWWGLAFLVAVVVLDVAVPWLARSGLSPRGVTIAALAGLLLCGGWGIWLLIRFTRILHEVVAATHLTPSRPRAADAAWDAVPADRIPAAVILLGAVAAGAIAANVWAVRALAPGWRARHLGEALAVGRSAVGRMAPEMALGTIDGRSLRLSDLRGKVVVLNFWATWCPPCLGELGDLARLSRDLEAEGGMVIGISNEDEATLRRFVAARRIAYPIVSGDGWPAPFDAIGAIPVTYVIGPGGMIAEEFVGARSYEAFRAAVERARIPDVGVGKAVSGVVE